MSKILALDFGVKRCGVAESDDLQIIASALSMVETKDLHRFLAVYLAKNNVDILVVGLPLRSSGELSTLEGEIERFLVKFRRQHPRVRVERVDESFTSVEAMSTMVAAGVGKKRRRDKGNLDKISATLILQRFLEQKRNNGY